MHHSVKTNFLVQDKRALTSYSFSGTRTQFSCIKMMYILLFVFVQLLSEGGYYSMILWKTGGYQQQLSKVRMGDTLIDAGSSFLVLLSVMETSRRSRTALVLAQ